MDTDAEQAQRHLFVATCRRAFLLGMQRSTGGNLSLRLGPDRLLVKPSGFSLYELAPEELLVCSLQGDVLEGSGKPTKELASHLAIYAARPDVGGIVHYHPPHATAFAVAGRPLSLLTVHAARKLGRVPLVEPPGEGSPELAQALTRTFRDGGVKAVLLARHGLMAVGRDLAQAQNLAELVEESAQVAILAHGLSGAGTPP